MSPTKGRPRRTVADRRLMKEMGERLLWVRQELGLSQQEIANQVGVHQTAWSLWERGERWPDMFEAMRLAAKLKVTTDYLLNGNLEGVEPRLAIRLAAHHPELVGPTDKADSKDTRRA